MSTREKMQIGSLWEWELWGKSSKRSNAYILEDAWADPNVMTDEGITYVLDSALSGGAQKTAWYGLIFNDDYTPAAGDTYQSPGFTESANYDEGARPTWQEAGVASLVLSNAANVASFTMSAEETIYGGGLVSANTKGDVVSGEVLLCASKFSTSKPVKDDQVLRLVVSVTGSNA